MHRPSLAHLVVAAAALALPAAAFAGDVSRAPETPVGERRAPAPSKQLTLLLSGNGHGEIGPCG